MECRLCDLQTVWSVDFMLIRLCGLQTVSYQTTFDILVQIGSPCMVAISATDQEQLKICFPDHFTK